MSVQAAAKSKPRQTVPKTMLAFSLVVVGLQTELIIRSTPSSIYATSEEQHARFVRQFCQASLGELKVRLGRRLPLVLHLHEYG